MVLFIYPSDNSTKRLRRIAKYLHRSMPIDNRLFIVTPSDKSKKDCHETIRKCTDKDLIIFFGHGCSNALYGAKGKNVGNPLPPSTTDPDKADRDDYYDEQFINEQTYDLFCGKKVIIYACKSAELGKKLCKAGARVVFGFGVIPTSNEEFAGFHIQSSNLLVAYMKGAITRILKDSLANALTTQCSFARLYRIFEYEFQREIERSLSSKQRFTKELVNALYRVKRELKIEGDLMQLLV